MLNVDDIESPALNVLINIKEGRNNILQKRIKIHSSRLSTQSSRGMKASSPAIVGGVSSWLGYLRLLAFDSMQIQQQAVAVLFERTP